jgi:hypothetical protein
VAGETLSATRLEGRPRESLAHEDFHSCFSERDGPPPKPEADEEENQDR